MTNIPNGVYYHGNSVIHRLNALTKLVCLLLLLVSIIASNAIYEYIVLFAIAFALIFISRLKLSAVLMSVKRLLPFFTVILLMNTCFFSNEQPWLSFWIFNPSAAGLRQGLNVVLRVVFLLIVSNIVTMTTPPVEMTTAIEQMLYPLRFVGVPVAQVAMILSVAIQFISTLLEEADLIRLAQTARGAQFDSRRLSERAGAAAPLAVPIFLAAFKRADELSLAMEARGYRVNKKRRVKRPHLKVADCSAILLSLLLLLIYLAF